MLRTNGTEWVGAPFPVDVPRPGVVVVSVDGEIDLLSVPRLRETLSSVESQDLRLLILDFARVTFMDSTGMHALVDARKRSHATDYEIVLADLNQPKRALEVAGLLREFGIAGDVEEALATFHR